MANMNPQSGDPFRPVSVDISNREQILEVGWEDGHKSIFPLYGLRKNCPCVACRGGHSEMGTYEMKLFFLENPPRVEIEDLEVVGNHAVRIVWSDGHNTGMYQWELLRAMCPQTYKAGLSN